jgi:tetratricopeptide (TPR) repeat protein
MPPAHDVVDPRPLRDPMTLRLPPRAGEPGPVPEVFRLRVQADGLVLVDDEAIETGLRLPDGVHGELERMLGEARPGEVLALLDDATRTAVLTDEQRAMLRARALLMDGRTDEARTALGDRDRPGIALGDAALALAEGDLERAERRVREARATDPSSLAAAYLWALVCVAQGEMAEGAELLGTVARTQPTHAVSRFQLGQILFAQGDPARAGTLYEMAWELQPAFVSPPLALAEMLVDGRQYAEALHVLDRICAAAPSALAPRQLQLRVLLEVGERDAAIDLGRRLHEQVPHDADTTLMYIDALIDAERIREARALIEAFQRGTHEPVHAVRGSRLHARVELAENRVDQAVHLLKEAVDKAPPALVGEAALELSQVAASRRRVEDLDAGLVALLRSSDLGALVSGALLARQSGMPSRARALAERARTLVQNTPAAIQLDHFIASL